MTERNINPASATAIGAIADVFFGEQKKETAVKMKHLLYMFSVVLLTAFLLAAPGRLSAGDKYQEMINCDLHAGPCTQSFSEYTVTLEVIPRPVKAMQDLAFKVKLNEKLPPNAELPYIDLGMPGMNMGPNRVRLKSSGKFT